MNDLQLPPEVELREIKASPPGIEEIENLARKAGGYEAIFNKRARKYWELGLNEKALIDDDYRHYLLLHYSFLKRPVLETDLAAIAGNSKKQIDAMKSLV
jgi:arsenate reductase